MQVAKMKGTWGLDAFTNAEAAVLFEAIVTIKNLNGDLSGCVESIVYKQLVI